MILARDVIPFLNVAFVASMIITIAMSLVLIPLAKRRKVGQALSWGEAMAASVYAFFVMFMAYGVVPHQFLTHADNELKWRRDKLFHGPGGFFKSKAQGGWFPFDLNYESLLRDTLAAGIYIVFLGLHIYLWLWWQKRGKPKKPAGALTTSTFGRPLVRKT